MLIAKACDKRRAIDASKLSVSAVYVGALMVTDGFERTEPYMLGQPCTPEVRFRNASISRQLTIAKAPFLQTP
jgi:hypothetical protein